MDGWMDRCVDGWIDGWVGRWMKDQVNNIYIIIYIIYTPSLSGSLCTYALSEGSNAMRYSIHYFNIISVY